MTARTRSLHTDLRYLLVLHIHRHGLTTVSEMVTMLADIGFDVDGRPSKTVSDALRTDVKLDRIRSHRWVASAAARAAAHLPH
ncbi:hypothetical protein FZI91_20570 [Mycobacterium sp. CBMA271]|uniref:hypothetical protein n=1 Tax=unclassified Mycobacteroides TaxID=2618759 RepID=UPI0012DE6C90|nr:MULTISPECIES: hypothetical protein [unclassified Mycobacteroides]MUM16929.1 hypothetical protein [Mycobacteroides sp. CBMA 326]MUM24082.1 hypothetical protein [Mycobacteroides sp. CBMA 271]